MPRGHDTTIPQLLVTTFDASLQAEFMSLQQNQVLRRKRNRLQSHLAETCSQSHGSDAGFVNKGEGNQSVDGERLTNMT
jgi:hypothetical protein